MARYVGEQGEWYYAYDFRFLLQRAIFIRWYTIVIQRGFFPAHTTRLMTRQLSTENYVPDTRTALRLTSVFFRPDSPFVLFRQITRANRTFPLFGKCSSTSTVHRVSLLRRITHIQCTKTNCRFCLVCSLEKRS